MSDARALKRAGRLGHRFALVVGCPGRRLFGESDSIERLAAWVTGRKLEEPAAWERVGGEWLLVPLPGNVPVREEERPDPAPRLDRDSVKLLRESYPGMLILARDGAEYCIACLGEGNRAHGVPSRFPADRLEYWLGKLLRAGCRVAVCERPNDLTASR